MHITEEDVLEFRKLCLEHEGVLPSDTEARETLGRLCLLFERFHAWRMREEAAGRAFPPDELPPDLEDNGRLR